MTAQDRLNELIGEIPPESEHWQYSGELSGAILQQLECSELIPTTKKQMLEDLLNQLPKRLTRENAALNEGWIDDEAVAYNQALAEVRAVLERYFGEKNAE